MSKPRFAEDMKAYLEYVDDLEKRYDDAVHHLRGWLKSMTPKELECLCLDHVIEYGEVPEALRTDFIRRFVKLDPKPEPPKESPQNPVSDDPLVFLDACTSLPFKVDNEYCISMSFNAYRQLQRMLRKTP